MADSENKTVHFQYKISCINTNVTVIGITHWIIIYVISQTGQTMTAMQIALNVTYLLDEVYAIPNITGK